MYLQQIRNAFPVKAFVTTTSYSAELFFSVIFCIRFSAVFWMSR